MKFPGIVLEEPIAEKIWYGEVKKISIPKSIKLENNPLYYMDKSNCFGIFKVQLLGELEDKNIY